MNLTLTNKQTMSSREIAELTGKPHNDLMKAIREMEKAWERTTGKNFPIVNYQQVMGNGAVREFPEYQLNKTECLYVATKFNDEARAKLILRWAELEANNQHQIPQNFSEALKLAYEQSVKIEEQQKQLEAQAPKVLFADCVSASNTSILIGELAKILKQNGVEKMGQNRLFEWLRNKGYLISRIGTDYNMPTQKSMELKLFEIKETPIPHSDGHITVNKTTKVTGKGQVYFMNKFLNKNNVIENQQVVKIFT